MRRRDFMKTSAYAAASLGFASGFASEAEATTPSEMPVVVLSGPARQRGRIHGETLKNKITEIIKIWKDDIGKTHKTDPDKYLSEFLEKTSFGGAIKRWTPDLEDEVRGIGEGSGVDYSTIFAYQLLDEEWWFALHKELGVPLPEARGCSVMGAFHQEGLPSLLAQNMDLGCYTDGFKALLRIKPSDSTPESLVFTIAGLIATCGVNDRSVGICCNTLLQLDHRPDGLPVAFIVRGVLAKARYSEAITFIHEIKHASGQCYTIGGPDEVSCHEASANKVVRFIPDEKLSRVYHTNHPLVNDDQTIFKEIQKKRGADQKAKIPGNSEIRFAAVEKRMKDPLQKVTVESIESTLRSQDDPLNPICRKNAGQGSMTAGSVIMELSRPPVLHAAPGPPCVDPYKAYRF